MCRTNFIRRLFRVCQRYGPFCLRSCIPLIIMGLDMYKQILDQVPCQVAWSYRDIDSLQQLQRQNAKRKWGISTQDILYPMGEGKPCFQSSTMHLSPPSHVLECITVTRAAFTLPLSSNQCMISARSTVLSRPIEQVVR